MGLESRRGRGRPVASVMGESTCDGRGRSDTGTNERAGRSARFGCWIGVGAPAQAGCGLASGIGDRLAGADDDGWPRSVDLGGRSLKSFSNSLGVDGLLGDELLGQGHEPIAVRGQDVRGPLVGPVDDRPDLFVDLVRATSSL